MHQGNLPNSGYRIKKVNNYLEDHRTGEDDPLKISIHSSAHKSPLKNSRNRSQGLRYLQHISNRTKKSSQSHLNSSNSNFSSKTRPNPTSKKIVEFTNVKQLLMISAYDKKLLRNVTTSTQANQKFLRLGDVRKDPYRRDTYKVLIEDFKEWVKRIRQGYSEVLNIFLNQNTNKSAIVTLGSVKPLLEEVKYQASMMHSRVKDCQECQDYREFGPLLLRFDTFLEAAKGFEDIIYIVNESKNHIDDLFKDLERDQQIDKKVNKERRRGIKKVRRAVQDYGDDNIEEKILGKVEGAINEMADKTLEAYSKIKGARGLMYRIKECMSQNKSFYDLDDIIRINEIFKQAMWEAEEFEKFSDRFSAEGDLLNDDLKQCISKYRNEMLVKKDAIYTMELQFILNIIETLVQMLQANFSVCNALDSSLCYDYVKVENLLESIHDIISDETVKTHIKVMLADNKPHFRKVEKLLKSFSSTPKSVVLDRKQGYNQLVDLYDNMEEYKASIKAMTDRSDRVFRKISNGKMRRQEFPSSDLQIETLQNILSISKKLNTSGKKKMIAECPAFQPVSEEEDIVSIAKGLADIEVLSWCKEVYEEYEHVCSNNEISTILEQLTIRNEVFQVSSLLLRLHSTAQATSQSNLVGQVEKIRLLDNKDARKLPLFQAFYERCLCVIACKGFEKRLIKILDDTNQIKFPETQHDIESLRRDIRYFMVVTHNLPEGILYERIANVSEAMKQMIQGVEIAEDLRWNKDELYYIPAHKIFSSLDQAFTSVFYRKELVKRQSLIEQVERVQKNLEKVEWKESHSGFHGARVEKTCALIQKYQKINLELLKKLEQSETHDPLEVYSELVFACCCYLQDTSQSYHATLNKSKNVIWISENPKDGAKVSQLGSKIGLPDLKAGELVSKYEDKKPVAKNKKPEPKPPKKVKEPKSRPAASDLDEDLPDEMEDEMPDQMGDEMQDEMEEYMQDEMDEDMVDEMEDDMPDEMEDDMPDDMPDEMEDDMDDDMAEDIPDDEMDDLADQVQEDQVGDDIQFEFDEKPAKKEVDKRPESKKKGQAQTIGTTQKPEQSLAVSDPAPKIQPKEDIPMATIKQKPVHRILEIFKYVETLQDLANLITKLIGLGNSFWAEADIKTIESYFNYETRDPIKQGLTNKLEQHCKKTFHADMLPSCRKSEPYRSILQQIDQLDCLNMQCLSTILASQARKYAQLVGKKGQLLRLSVEKGQEWKSSNVIEQYVKKQLSLLGLDSEAEKGFELKEYKKQMLKMRKEFETRYQMSEATLQPNIEELKVRIAEINSCVEAYKDMSKFPDGMDLGSLITKMWINYLLGAQAEQYQIPTKLHQDIQRLAGLLQTQNFLHYVNGIKQASYLVKQLKEHHQKLTLILNKKDEKDLLRNINLLSQIYDCKPPQLIKLEDRPIFLRSSQSSVTEDNKPIEGLLKAIFLPSDQGSGCVDGVAIQAAIKKKPELYAGHPKQIAKLLSILDIESHLWASETSLEIKETRDEIVAAIIAERTSGIITKPDEELKNMKEILSDLLERNLEESVWEYSVKANSIFDTKNNNKFYQQFKQAVTKYEGRKNYPTDVSRCIIESLCSLEEADGSSTASVLQYLDSLSDILKDEAFSTKVPYPTIFTYHIDTQDKLGQILMKINSENSLLEKIIEPVVINLQVTAGQCLQELDDKNKAVVQWYCQFPQVEKKALHVVYVGDGEARKLIYVGKKQGSRSHCLSSVVKLFSNKTSEQEIYNLFLQKHLAKLEDGQFASSSLFNWEGFLGEFASLQEDYSAQYREFLIAFNQGHFLKENTHQAKQKKESILEKKKKQVSALQFLLEDILASLPASSVAYQLVTDRVKDPNSSSLQSDLEKQRDQLSHLEGIKFVDYSTFGKWVIEVMGKMNRMEFSLLMDKFSPESMIAILSSTQENKIKQQLISLRLPVQFELQKKTSGFQKIHLKDQHFCVKLNSGVSRQELLEMVEGNFGYLDEQNTTLVIAVYQKCQKGAEELLGCFQISDKLQDQGQFIDVSLTQYSLTLDIKCRIVKSKIKATMPKPTDQLNFATTVFEEKYEKVYLDQSIEMVGMSTQLKRLHTEMLRLQKKRKEQEEKRRLEEEERIRKEEEEARFILQQEEKRKEQEQKERKANQEQKHMQQSISVYLEQLYEKLAQKHLYSIPKQKIKINGKNQNKEEVKLGEIVSGKNLDLRDATIQTIKNIEAEFEPEDPQEENYQNAATQAYLSALEDFIMKRQELLARLIAAAKEGASAEDADNQNPLPEIVQEKVLKEIQSLPSYEPTLEEPLKQQLNLLSESERELLLI